MKIELSLPGFRNMQLIHSGGHTLIYRAIRNLDNQKVILKIPNTEYPLPKEIQRLKYEYEILQSMDSDKIIKAISLEPIFHYHFLVLQDSNGTSIHEILKQKKKFSPHEFLPIAIQIAKALGVVHDHHIIHKDINPSNITLNTEKNQIQLIDFGISSVLSREAQQADSPDVLEGTLNYISPEQTGRMNRVVDYRSDLYSLGVTFYEMLTGQLPFPGFDPVELVHSHIAKSPTPPLEVEPDIPDALSNIIMILMSKTAEERYQSCYGLVNDLEICKQQLNKNNRIDNFPLKQKDISEKFQISQKLYGRSNEVNQLVSVFHSVTEGNIELLLISGLSGIGKTALIQELYKPVTQAKGYFVSGKSEQLQRNTPYFGIVNALRNLVQQISTERNDRLNKWKSRLLKALEPNAQIIVDLIPELEDIIGTQPAVMELNPAESQNRFRRTLLNFISVFARESHPLVIFLDDLQWSDSSSLSLLKSLVTSEELSYLFIVGTYRENEKDEFLQLTLDEIQKSKHIHQISLQPLDKTAITEFIADTLYSSLDTVKPLVEVLYNKTNGNPFFINELLKHLHQNDSIYFNSEKGKWLWNLEAIQQAEISTNVLEFILSNLQKLPEETIHLLQLASCIGSTFDLNTLSLLNGNTAEKTGKAFWEAIKKGAILPLQANYLFHTDTSDSKNIPSYKFQHDRVQQAAYTMLGEHEKKEVHLSLGRLLNSNTENQEEQIVEIVRHLNIGRELIVDPTEKLKLVELNLSSSRKARNAAAYYPALEYVKVGFSLLPENSWETHYDLTYQLNLEYSKSAYLSGQFEEAEACIQKLISYIQSPLQKAEIYKTQVLQYSVIGKYEDAIRLGIEALSLIGISIGIEPSKEDIGKEIALIKTNLGERKIISLLDSPELKDRNMQLALKIMTEIFSSSFLTGKISLVALLGLKMASISLQYGNISESAFGFACYGLVLGAVLGDFKTGYEFGKLAIAMNNKFQDRKLHTRVAFIYAAFILHWNEHWSEMTPVIKQAMEIGLHSGDLFYFGFCSMYYIAWDPSLNLDSLCKELTKSIPIVKSTGAKDPLAINVLFLQFYKNLCGLTVDRFSFNDSNFKEDDFFKGLSVGSSAAFYILKAETYCLYGDYSNALNYVKEADKVIHSRRGLPYIVRLSMISFLCYLNCYNNLEESEKEAAWSRIQKELEQMKKWTEHCPKNYSHLYNLMEAQLAGFSGKHWETVQWYENAIRLARENKYLRDEAMATELAAKFYLKQGMVKIAALYVHESHYLYHHWGANAKLKHIAETYPELIKERELVQKRLETSTHTTLSTTLHTEDKTGKMLSSSLDLQSIIKATQALSGEIKLNSLIHKFISIIIENAGAEKGYFIIKEGDELFIIASAKAKSEEIDQGKVAIQEYNMLPHSIIEYVDRTKKTLVLNDASKEGQFTGDLYIQTKYIKSVLCLPLVQHGRLKAIIYLENNLTAGAFTEDRIKTLNILTSQASISFENAQLYEHMEDKVRDRTHKLKQSLEEIKTLKNAQDGDYFLTSLLLKPLQSNENTIRNVKTEFIVKQKKEFQFKNWNSELGGDLCITDTIQLNNKTYTVFCNADAMGKSTQGAGGALIAGVVFKSGLMRSKNTANQQLYPEIWLRERYMELQQVFLTFDGSMFISACIGLVDSLTGTLYYFNAEHPQAILYRDGKASFLPEGIELRKIGTFDQDKSFNVSLFQLEDGDSIILGSDGRDDIKILDPNYGVELVQEDETQILRRIEEANGDLKEVINRLKEQGTIIDDLSLLKITYNRTEK